MQKHLPELQQSPPFPVVSWIRSLSEPGELSTFICANTFNTSSFLKKKCFQNNQHSLSSHMNIDAKYVFKIPFIFLGSTEISLREAMLFLAILWLLIYCKNVLGFSSILLPKTNLCPLFAQLFFISSRNFKVLIGYQLPVPDIRFLQFQEEAFHFLCCPRFPNLIPSLPLRIMLIWKSISLLNISHFILQRLHLTYFHLVLSCSIKVCRFPIQGTNFRTKLVLFPDYLGAH